MPFTKKGYKPPDLVTVASHQEIPFEKMIRDPMPYMILNESLSDLQISKIGSVYEVHGVEYEGRIRLGVACTEENYWKAKDRRTFEDTPRIVSIDKVEYAKKGVE